MNETDPTPQPAPRADLSQGPTAATAPSTAPQPAAPPTTASASASAGFDFNHPTIISLLYISSAVLGVTAIVGVVLAYVWKGEAHAEWETSHYDYLIRTFWIGLIGTVVSVILMIVLVGFFLLLATGVLVIVRCILSLVNAQKRQPMPNPGTWLA